MSAIISVKVLSPDWTTGRQIAAGNEFSLAVTSNNGIHSWGDNDCRQLGSGATNRGIKDPNPGPVVESELGNSELKGAVILAAGNDHALAVKDDGSLCAWGRNRNFQLGVDTGGSNATAPVRVPVSRVRRVAAGTNHSLAVDSSGKLYAWGWNKDGQLGLGNTIDSLPKEVTALAGKTVAMVAAGFGHSLALTSEGEVYAWGLNSKMQLGIGGRANSTKPTKVSGLPADVIAVAAGLYHSVVLTASGEVWTFGLNAVGQLGDGTLTNRDQPVKVNSDFGGAAAIAIAAGEHHTMVLSDTGEVWVWGRNNEGQLARDTSDLGPDLTPRKLGFSNIVAISSYRWGGMVLSSIGELHAWGANNKGQVGNDGKGETTAELYGKQEPVQYTPVKIPVAVNPDSFPEGSTFEYWDRDQLTSSRPVTFIIDNLGDADLDVSGVDLLGVNPEDFEIATRPSSPIKPNQSTTMTVVFHPRTPGDKTAMLAIKNNASNDGEFSFYVAGRSRGLEIADAKGVIPAGGSRDLGTIAHGANGSFQFTITNRTGRKVVISKIEVDNPGNYSITTSLSYPYTLADEGTLTVDVKLSGQNAGTQATKVSIHSDAAGSPAVFTLTGQVQAPQIPNLEVTDMNGAPIPKGSTQNIGSVPPTDRRYFNVRLHNPGPNAVQVTGISLSDTVNFEITSTYTYPLTIPAGSDVRVDLALSGAHAGAQASTCSTLVTITSNAPNTPHTFTLQGTVQAKPSNPRLVVKQYYSYTNIYEVPISNGMSTTFNEYRPQDPFTSLAYYIENPGDGNLVLQGASITDNTNFALKVMVGSPQGPAPTFPATVQPGGRYILYLLYYPKTQGPHQTSVTLRTSDPAASTFTWQVNIPSSGGSYGGSGGYDGGGGYGGGSGGYGGGSGGYGGGTPALILRGPDGRELQHNTDSWENFIFQYMGIGRPQSINLTLENRGNGPANLRSQPFVYWGATADFSVSGGGQTVIQPGQSVPFTLTYNPRSMPGPTTYAVVRISWDQGDWDYYFQVRA